MASTSEFVIGSDGRLFRRDIAEIEMEISQQSLDGLAAGVIRKAPNVFNIKDWGFCHLASGNNVNEYYITVKINRIPMRAHWFLTGKEGSQYLVPDFTAKQGQVMDMEWVPFEGMFLSFLCLIQRVDFRWQANRAWLFAHDEQRRFFKLPLPNVFEDCRICEGDWNRNCTNAQEGVSKALEQFANSHWNADLWKTREQTQNMFRFQPRKDTFQQLNYVGDHWTNLCAKVGVDVAKYVVE